jgi:hypothetical protein
LEVGSAIVGCWTFFLTGGLVVVVVGGRVVVVVAADGGGAVTLPTMVIESEALAVLGLTTSATVRVSTSPELIVLGTVKVTLSVPPPVTAAVTVPEPLELVESVML